MWRKGIAIQIVISVVVAAAAALLPTSPALAGGRGEPIMGDVNGDGNEDLIYLGIIQPDSCSVIVRHGRPTGGYQLPTAYVYMKPGGTGTGIACPDLGVAVDLTNDNIDELVIGWFAGTPASVDYNLLVLDPTFAPLFALPDALFQPSYLGLADFDGDGRQDVYSTTDQGEGFETHLNLADDGTLTNGPVRFCAGPITYELQDFNNNGAMDVLISYLLSCDDQTNGVVVVLDDGSVAQLQRDELEVDCWTSEIVFANADTIPDVRTTSEVTGQVDILIGRGDGTFVRAPTAVADSVTLSGAAPTIINVLANDFATSSATVEIVEGPRYGTAVVLGDGRVHFTPAPGNRATDRFVYRLSDNGRRSNTSVHVRYSD